MKIFTRDARISEAVMWAKRYFNSDDFKKDILSVEKFDHSNIKPDEIVKLFGAMADHKEIEIKCTYFGFFYKKVLGRTVGDGIAYLNSSNLGRQVWSVGATVVHEVSHIVDEFYPHARFGHGSNKAGGKGMSFPYFIGDRAENWIKKEKLIEEAKRLSMEIALKRNVLWV